MSAPHITTKEVRRRYPHVIDGGNCRWPYLTEHICLWEKVGYNAGLYGWNYDVYEVDRETCLVTGDRPPDGNVTLDLDRMYAYEREADFIAHTRGGVNYAGRRSALKRKVMNHIRRAVGNG